MKKQILLSVLVAVAIILVIAICLYKPSIKNATTEELDGVYGIRQGGVIMSEIQEFILNHPDAKVEDLRVIKGVDDMIINQLKEKFR